MMQATALAVVDARQQKKISDVAFLEWDFLAGAAGDRWLREFIMIKMWIWWSCFVMLLTSSLCFSEVYFTFQQLNDRVQKFPSAELQGDRSYLMEQLISEFHDVHKQEAIFRGFIYKTLAGDFFLSSEPDLKSCCIGSSKTIWRQIALEGHFQDDMTNQLVLMRGMFLVDVQQNNHGDFIRVFTLKDASLMQQEAKTPWMTLGAITVMGLLAILWVVVKKHN